MKKKRAIKKQLKSGDLITISKISGRDYDYTRQVVSKLLDSDAVWEAAEKVIESRKQLLQPA